MTAFNNTGGWTRGPLQVVEGSEVWDTRGDGAPGIPLVKADLGLNRRWGRGVSASEIVGNLTLFAAAPELVEAAADALSGWHYIRQVHGDLPGVAWDRVDEALTAALSKARGQ